MFAGGIFREVNKAFTGSNTVDKVVLDVAFHKAITEEIASASTSPHDRARGVPAIFDRSIGTTARLLNDIAKWNQHILIGAWPQQDESQYRPDDVTIDCG